MDEINQLVVVYVAAAHLLLSMMTAVIESRKRKHHDHAPIGQICYDPIEDRNMSRIDYLNNKIWKNDVICVNMLRLTKGSFIRFCVNMLRLTKGSFIRSLFGNVVYCMTPFTCVLNNKL
jgi:hypothetical protein